jgi:hypothetical protein
MSWLPSRLSKLKETAAKHPGWAHRGGPRQELCANGIQADRKWELFGSACVIIWYGRNEFDGYTVRAKISEWVDLFA